MSNDHSLVSVHPTGEQSPVAVATALPPTPTPLDTFGGLVQIEWDRGAALSPLGQAVYFINFLKTSGRYDDWLAGCPLPYTSSNAPKAAEVGGTALLSILSGYSRYAHITALRGDGVMPELLGMKKIMSEDAMRRGFAAMAGNGGEEWLQKHIDRDIEPLLAEPYIIDVDTTVKLLYGHQEGAVVSYNPKKRGRPSHVVHTYFMGGTRLVMGVELAAGNEHTGKHAAPGFWAMIDRRPKDLWPHLVRGDKGIASQSMMQNCETRNIDFLFKLKMSANAKKLVSKAVTAADWCDVGQGWEGREGQLRLVGWSRHRRVVVMRRWRRDDGKSDTSDNAEQLLLGLAMVDAEPGKYEYAILVTSLQYELSSSAQLYRDRADCENVFDELKYQWGWGGFTTQDLARCKLSGRKWWRWSTTGGISSRGHRRAGQAFGSDHQPAAAVVGYRRTRSACSSDDPARHQSTRSYGLGPHRPRARCRFSAGIDRSCGAVESGPNLEPHPERGLPRLPERPPIASAAPIIGAAPPCLGRRTTATATRSD